MYQDRDLLYQNKNLILLEFQSNIYIPITLEFQLSLTTSSVKKTNFNETNHLFSSLIYMVRSLRRTQISSVVTILRRSDRESGDDHGGGDLTLHKSLHR